MISLSPPRANPVCPCLSAAFMNYLQLRARLQAEPSKQHGVSFDRSEAPRMSLACHFTFAGCSKPWRLGLLRRYRFQRVMACIDLFICRCRHARAIYICHSAVQGLRGKVGQRWHMFGSIIVKRLSFRRALSLRACSSVFAPCSASNFRFNVDWCEF